MILLQVFWGVVIFFIIISFMTLFVQTDKDFKFPDQYYNDPLKK